MIFVAKNFRYYWFVSAWHPGYKSRFSLLCTTARIVPLFPTKLCSQPHFFLSLRIKKVDTDELIISVQYSAERSWVISAWKCPELIIWSYKKLAAWVAILARALMNEFHMSDQLLVPNYENRIGVILEPVWSESNTFRDDSCKRARAHSLALARFC